MCLLVGREKDWGSLSIHQSVDCFYNTDDFGQEAFPSSMVLSTRPSYIWTWSLFVVWAKGRALLWGCYKGTPKSSRFCPCGANCVESPEYIFLSCPLHKPDYRQKYLVPILVRFQGWIEADVLWALFCQWRRKENSTILLSLPPQ